jgi:hypothetical protein
MPYYGRFRHSEPHPLLVRINRRVQQWIRAKYRRLRAYRAMKRAWERLTAPPGLGNESKWRLVTGDCHARICGSPVKFPWAPDLILLRQFLFVE